ncbi:hypothetical protein A5765_01820 [Mycolicibacterium celeriflavum]|uniref:Uncharacterized protein n=1 Tax=Mycolicibacterium celeriflavum TaxID=1249101 RepID=A0A1X0BMV4_MYCCF|nr:EspA/EspE family type VII secretion system effector [Mycolicibacterium celeriflavum]MCV7241011.1 DUF4226 domain-containing protein [Mycolicibacterium celeriflavum]OBG19815.1 hypothetical protein A5765_01820 [Mycolicibacterium celeriflavum]ORA44094.1 hypothetical protein BST21_20265 [Mycolicibacterium celeriflavum]BBY45632.1 hypothetical protein MCEL_39270 [Mycolicibacterium celeriflavum]
MSVLAAFLSTWERARTTFGEGTPHGGDGFDHSARLRRLQSDVDAVAPRDWTGAGSESYAEANQRQSRALAAMADLDQRLKAEVDRSAAVVAAGRRELEGVRQWVVDTAATVPRTAAGERMLWPVISRGASEVADIVRRSHGELSAIAERMRGLAGEYEELSGRGKDDDAETVSFMSDDEDEPSDEVPPTTLDLADIEYLDPSAKGRPGMMELIPGSGVWVPDPGSPTYQPKTPEAPLDLNDIEYLGPGVKGEPWQMELVPGSGAWVPNPNYPGYEPHIPEAPVDLTEIEIVDPQARIPAGMVELWPRSGVLIPDPYSGSPF